MSVAENLEGLRKRIAAAAERGGREAADIRLVGASSASKGVTPALVLEAMDAGLRDFGENYVQEAEVVQSLLGERAAEACWHFIGHLQTNKVPAALKLFAIIQSVDSLRLAEHLSRRGSAGHTAHILLEVNVAQEASKYGLAPSEVATAVEAIGRLPNVEVDGLMTMAPAVTDAEQARPVFRELRELAQANGLRELSMGMTDDFEVAIEEGATIIRLGRAIFGAKS